MQRRLYVMDFFFLPFRNKWAGNVEGECRVLFLALRNVVVTQKLTALKDCRMSNRNIAFTLQVNGIINEKCRWGHSTLISKRVYSLRTGGGNRERSHVFLKRREREALVVLHN